MTGRPQTKRPPSASRSVIRGHLHADGNLWPGVRGGHMFVHRITVISQMPGRFVLGPACRMQARDYCTNRWLESLIMPP